MNDYTILLCENPMTYSNLIYSLLNKDTGFSFRRWNRERQFPVLSFPRTIYLSSCCKFLRGEGSCCREMGRAWLCTQRHVSSLGWSSPSLQGQVFNNALLYPKPRSFTQSWDRRVVWFLSPPFCVCIVYVCTDVYMCMCVEVRGFIKCLWNSFSLNLDVIDWLD